MQQVNGRGCSEEQTEGGDERLELRGSVLQSAIQGHA
jgi:hypothetical protein